MPARNFDSLLREPLLHFLLIGATLFFVYDLLNEDEATGETIVINKAQIDHLGKLWQKKRLREPTEKELDGLIEQQIRQEVMVREALAMGLDTDDTIIRRRLAQKMEFITTDLATLVEPTEKQLNDHLSAHSERFVIPAILDFQQVFINPEKHGEDAQLFAEDLLKKLRQDELSQTDRDTYLRSSGDTLMLDREYKQMTEHDISRWFGNKFAGAIFELPVASWQGPVHSGYGLHLVFISNKIPAQTQALEVVHEAVRADWQAEQRKELDQNLYQKLRQRYQVIVER